MKSLHTIEEIFVLEKKKEISDKLQKMYELTKEERLKELADTLLKEYQIELDKYLPYVGLECYAPESGLSDRKGKRKGVIEKFTHFNTYSQSVRCNFRYANGGFDGHTFTELTTQSN